jgi:hypothetical protein
VSGYQQVGCPFGECVDRGADAWGKEGAAQVQAAEQCMQPGDAGQHVLDGLDQRRARCTSQAMGAARSV